jgi:hypothetical protein
MTRPNTVVFETVVEAEDWAEEMLEMEMRVNGGTPQNVGLLRMHVTEEPESK